jgi:hypothetical protein
VGVIASSSLAVLCGSIFLLVLILRPSWDSLALVLAVFGIATLIFSGLALRFAYGETRTLSSFQVKTVSYIVVASGLFLVVTGLLSGPNFMMLAVGTTGIGAGILNLLRDTNAP